MSFNLNDAKWGTPTNGQSGGQVTWAADLSSGLQFDTNAHSAGNFDNALASAFQAWENVAAIDFVQTTNLANADIVVSMGALGGSVVGNASITQAVLPGTDRIVDVDITLDSTEVWDPTTGPDLNFFAVAAHEIGHAIGLGHVNDTTEIMNDVIRMETLGDGDIAGAQAIYGQNGGAASSPSGGSSGVANQSSFDGGDDGGSSGGGLIALLLGAIAALLGGLSGGGPAVAMALLAGRAPEDEEETGEDSLEDDLLAFLNEAYGDLPEGVQYVTHDHLHDHGHDHSHDHSHDHAHCSDPACDMCGGHNLDDGHDHSADDFCLDPTCSLCGGHLKLVDDTSEFTEDMGEFAQDMDEDTEELSLLI